MTTSGHAPPKFATVLDAKLYIQGRGLHLTEDFPSAAGLVEKRTPAFKGR